ALLLQLLPVAGDGGPGLFAAVLLVGFPNLAIVAVVAPLAGLWLRARPPAMPAGGAPHRAGAGPLPAGARVRRAPRPRPPAARPHGDLAIQAASARRFVINQAPREFQDNVDHLNTWKQAADLYRTCVAGDDPTRAFCVFVNTDQSPPGVTRDPDE